MGDRTWEGLAYVSRCLLDDVQAPQAALWVADDIAGLKLVAGTGIGLDQESLPQHAALDLATAIVRTPRDSTLPAIAVLAVPPAFADHAQTALDEAAPALRTAAVMRHYQEKADRSDAVLEAIADQAAVLSPDGVILQTNSAWSTTPESHRRVIERSPVGTVYTDALRSQTSHHARLAAEGIEAVLKAALPSFQSDYDTDVDAGDRSYSLQVDPVPSGGAVVRHMDISFRKHLQRELAHRATHDALTGLPNRMVMNDRLTQALARAQTTGRGMALLFCDVDAFKQINDSLGHAAGDKVLTTIARRLQATVRQSDVVARFGGDEFIVLMEDIAEETAAHTRAAELQKIVSTPITVDGRPLHFSVSIGISVYGRGTGNDTGAIKAILADADAAMYHAKKAGHGSIKSVIPRSEEFAALDNAEISVLVQPIVDLDSGAAVCYEVFARLDMPDQRQLSPADFLQTAEETGAIIDIGRRVLAQALDFSNGGVNAVSVNVSWAELAQPHYADSVLAALLTAGVQPQRLELEILMPTATSIAALTTLRRLRDAGVAITIDAFGRQPVELSTLPELAATGFKVDRALTAAALHSQPHARLVRGLVMMAHNFGWTSTAEGIESAELAAAARSMGFQRAQGFHFGTPVPASAVGVR